MSAERTKRAAACACVAALDVVRRTEAEPRIRQLPEQATGILIVPTNGRARLGAGAPGHAG